MVLDHRKERAQPPWFGRGSELEVQEIQTTTVAPLRANRDRGSADRWRRSALARGSMCSYRCAVSSPSGPARAGLCAALCGLALGAAGLVVARSAGAQPTSTTSVPPGDGAAAAVAAEGEPATESRRHFDNGIKLYRDGNFRGALVEFEAAHEIVPSAGALRNVALCQKALFRYAEAAETLRSLLRGHGAELAAGDRATIEAAITELDGLVGVVVLVVSPPEAAVTVDGRTVTAEERAAGLRLNVGEHTVTAAAPGYAPLTSVVSVASGRHEVPVELALDATMGFLSVEAGDPDAAIAIDGEARAFQRWSGPLPPGRHRIQIYKEGHEPFDQRVRVELGKTVEVTADFGPSTDEEAAAMKLGTPPPPPLPGSSLPHQGWYAAGTLNVLALGDAPRGMEHVDGTVPTEIGGVTTGLRAGYRLLTPLATEVVVEGGGFPVSNACDQLEFGPACDAEDALRRPYRLTLVRLGGNVRLLTSGEKLRFASSAGTGAVRHRLAIPELDDARLAELVADRVSLIGVEPERDVEGWNAYFMLELGLELNLRHVLLGAGAQLCIDSTAHTVADDGYEPFAGLVMGGIALRAGWSEWTPRRGAKLRVTAPPGGR